MFLTITLLVLPCFDCLGISTWMSGANCYTVLESGTQNILASDSSSESPGSTRWWSFVSGKELGRLRLSSDQSKYSTPRGFFTRSELLALDDVNFIVLVDRKKEVKLGRPLQTQARRWRAVTLSAYWIYVSYGVYVGNGTCLPEVYYNCML